MADLGGGDRELYHQDKKWSIYAICQKVLSTLKGLNLCFKSFKTELTELVESVESSESVEPVESVESVDHCSNIALQQYSSAALQLSSTMHFSNLALCLNITELQ